MIIQIKSKNFAGLATFLCVSVNLFWAYLLAGRSPYLYALIFAVCLYLLDTVCTLDFKVSFFALSVLILLLLIFISGLWAISSYYYSRVLRSMIPGAIVFMFVSNKSFNKLWINLIIWGFVISVVIFAITTIIAGNTSNYYGRLTYIVNGIEYNGAYFGFFLVPAFLLLLFDWDPKKKMFFRLFQFAGAGVILVYLFRAGFRTTLASTICSVAVYFISVMLFEKHKWKNIVLALLFVVVLFFVSEYILTFVSVSVTKSLTTDFNEASFVARLRTWKGFFNLLEDKNIFELLFGCGFGCTAVHLRQSMHNIFMEFFDCNGLVGLGLIIFIYAMLIKKAWKQKNKIVLSILANNLIHNMMLSGQESRFFWMDLVVIVVLLGGMNSETTVIIQAEPAR